MNPIELIQRKNRSITVIYHKYILIRRMYGSSTLYCFFEGNEDNTYYAWLIKHYFNTFEPIVCNGKKNVIGIWNELKSKKDSNEYMKVFFIDRDFDEQNTESDIYETPCYSIENLFCSKNFFIELLKNEFKITVDNPNFQKCVDFYIQKQSEFHEATLLFNAWYYSLKKKGECEVSLYDKFPSDFIDWNFDGTIKGTYDLTSCQAMYPKTSLLSQEEFEKSINELKNEDLAMKLRGKYEIEFSKKMIRYLIEDANNPSKRNFLPAKVKFNFQDSLFISQTSQYADILECAKVYLEKTKLAYL